MSISSTLHRECSGCNISGMVSLPRKHLESASKDALLHRAPPATRVGTDVADLEELHLHIFSHT